MEEKYDEDFEFVIDTQLNSRILKKYIQEPSLRNKIITSGNQLIQSSLISNKYINDFIQFLFESPLKEIFKSIIKIEIQANEYNIGVSINIIVEEEIITLICYYLLKYSKLVYLIINKKAYLNNYYIDYLNKNILIQRNFSSFHQNDDTVKKYLYNFIITNSPKFCENLILFGGEMYGFSSLIKHKNLFAYSDYESIIEDTLLNTPKETIKEIKLVNYDKYSYELSKENCLLICNTSKSGLGRNLSCQINKIQTDYAFIISCNKKSFLKDYLELSKVYHIIKNLEINNINIYLLQKY